MTQINKFCCPIESEGHGDLINVHIAGRKQHSPVTFDVYWTNGLAGVQKYVTMNKYG